MAGPGPIRLAWRLRYGLVQRSAPPDRGHGHDPNQRLPVEWRPERVRQTRRRTLSDGPSIDSFSTSPPPSKASMSTTTRGDFIFIYDPDRNLPTNRKHTFAASVTCDRHDTVADLERPDVFLFNVAATPETYNLSLLVALPTSTTPLWIA